MTSLRLAIAAIALAFAHPSTPRGHVAETAAAYSERIDTIALAIDDVASTPEQAAALLVIAYSESRFDPLVHAGLPHPVLTQDHGRARSLYQIHDSKNVQDWAHLGGTDLESTKRATEAALRILKSSAWMCHAQMLSVDDMARVFAEYGSGMGGCIQTAESRRRAVLWERVRAQLWRTK